MKIVIITKDKKGKDAQNMSFWRFFGNVLKTIYFASLCFITQVFGDYLTTYLMNDCCKYGKKNDVLLKGCYWSGVAYETCTYQNIGTTNCHKGGTPTGEPCIECKDGECMCAKDTGTCALCPAGYYCDWSSNNMVNSENNDVKGIAFQRHTCPRNVEKIYYNYNGSSKSITLGSSVDGAEKVGKEGAQTVEDCYTALTIDQIKNTSANNVFKFTDGFDTTKSLIYLKKENNGNGVWTYAGEAAAPYIAKDGLVVATGYKNPYCTVTETSISCSAEPQKHTINLINTMTNTQIGTLYTKYEGTSYSCGNVDGIYGGVYKDTEYETPILLCVPKCSTSSNKPCLRNRPLPVPQMPWYMFSGFYDNSGVKIVNACGQITAEGDRIGSQTVTDLTWYSRWLDVYSIRFLANGGTYLDGNNYIDYYDANGYLYKYNNGSDLATNCGPKCQEDADSTEVTVTQCQIESFSVPKRSMYIFDGFTNSDGMQLVSSEGIINDIGVQILKMANESQLWYAKWTPIHKILLNLNGGSLASGNVNTLYSVNNDVTNDGCANIYKNATVKDNALSSASKVDGAVFTNLPALDGALFNGFVANGQTVIDAEGNLQCVDTITANQNWVAQWALCPAGSYCAGGNKTDCPKISSDDNDWTVTSPAGSNSVDDCYATKTINDNGCYGTLRANKNANDNGWTYDISGVYPNTGYGALSCTNGTCTCTPNKYKITLNKNGGRADGDPTTKICSEYADSENIYSYDNGCTTSEITKINIPTKDKNKFMGYFNQVTGGLQMINDKGALTNDGGAVASGILSNNTVWYAQWTEGVTISLNLDVENEDNVGGNYLKSLYALKGDKAIYTDDKFTTNTGNIAPSGYSVPQYLGHEFNGYINSNGVKMVDGQGAILSSMLSPFATDTTWYAQWNLCSAGFYCTTGKRKECPKDSKNKTGTSAPGSSKITDCYIEEEYKGDNCTGSVKIYYVGTADSGDYTNRDYTGVRAKTGYTLDSNGTCSANKYVISLSSIGATNAGTAAVCSQYGDGLKLYEYKGIECEETGSNQITIPEKNGYKFAGFYTQSSGGLQMIDGDGKLTVSGGNVAKDLTVNTTWYAQWNKLYTVTLYPNGATGLNPISFYTVGGILYTDQNGQDQLSVSWCTQNNQNILSCSANIANAKDGVNYIFKKPTSGNKLFFDGYYNAANKSSGVKVVGDDGIITDPYGTNDLNSERNLYWYVQWREANIYTINLNKDGGTGGDSKYYWTEFEEDKIYTDNGVTSELMTDGGNYKMLYLPTKSGYLFNGYCYKPSDWNDETKPYGKECIDNEGGFVYNDNKWNCHTTGDISLNPQWTPIHKITLKPTDAASGKQGTTVLYVANDTKTFYDSNNVNNTGGEQTIAGTSIETIQIPERAGYVFGGYKYNGTDVVNESGVISSGNVTSDQEWEVVWNNCPAGYYCPGGVAKACPGYDYINTPTKSNNHNDKCTAITDENNVKGYMCNINETDLKQTINTYLYGFELKAELGQSLPNNKKDWTTNNAQVTDCTLSLINGECYTYNSGYTMPDASPSVVEYKYDASQKKYIRVTQKVQIATNSARIKSEPVNDDLTRDYCTLCKGVHEFNVNGVCQGCGAGFYITGKNNDNDPGVCQICPAGYMCPNGEGNKPILCPANSFARAGSAYCSPCAEGYTTKVGYDRGLCLLTASEGNNYVKYPVELSMTSSEQDVTFTGTLNDSYVTKRIIKNGNGEYEITQIIPELDYVYGYGIGCISPDACKAIKPEICLDSICSKSWQWDLLDYITPLDVNSAVIQKR